MKDEPKNGRKKREQYKRLVLDTWDRLERTSKREFLDKKAELERINRKKL